MKKDNLKLVRVDSKYCDYLRRFDKNVPYNYDKKKLRPFVGVLFSVDDKKYFAPLASPKSKHLKMVSTIDFLKIDGGKLGAINFNNMIPVMDRNVVIIDLNKKILSKDEKIYNKLLKEQISWLIRHDARIYVRSKRLYQKQIMNRLPKRINDRCCNFRLLEEKCLEYNKEYVNN